MPPEVLEAIADESLVEHEVEAVEADLIEAGLLMPEADPIVPGHWAIWEVWLEWPENLLA